MAVRKVSAAHIASLAPREDFPILAQTIRGVHWCFWIARRLRKTTRSNRRDVALL